MYGMLVILNLLAVVLVGCTVTPIPQTGSLPLNVSAEVSAGSELGIATDLELRVTALQPGSVAERADIQIGDILVALQWEQAAMPEMSPNAGKIALDEKGRPTFNGQVITEPVAIPAATIPPQEYVETDPIPFTEPDRIVSLVGYGFPLKLKLMRDGEEITISITPGPRTQPLMELPERTDPDKHAYYFF